MADELEKRNEETVVDNTDYIAAIKELKENSVDKGKYDTLKAENKKLLDALVNGSDIDTQSSQPELGTRLEYYKAYKENKFNTDLDYWTNFLNLREATIKEYGRDPLVTGNYGLTPEGEKVEPAYGEAEAMDNLCNGIAQMIDEADGDPNVFRVLFESARNKK